MHYYLKGLKQGICQFVESNRNNLADMMTLKLACLRQDVIVSSIQGGSPKMKKIGEDSALISSTQNSGKQNF